MIVTPLVYNGIPLGVLKSLSNQPSFFTDQDAALMRSFSRILAAALFHARRQSETSLFQRATRDWLTGLANRGLFEDRAQHDIAQAKRNDSCVAVFVIDINKFKSINDTYGHKIGDAVLQETADRIRQCIRQSDTAARLGGDEFALLLTSIDDTAGCEVVKERLEKAFKPPFSIAGKSLQISVSTGFAFAPDGKEELDELLTQADEAMYEKLLGSENS